MTRRLSFIVAGMLLLTGVAFAQSRKFTFEQLTVAGSAVGITSTVLATPAGGQPLALCVARLETAQIRFRVDGTDPSATVGTVLDPGDVLTIPRIEDASVVRFIRTGSTSGVLDIHCEPQP